MEIKDLEILGVGHMIKYKGVYVLKLSNWSFPDIQRHNVEPPQPLGAPPGAPVWQVASDWPAHPDC
jgi:hypothetical protein